jgi:hypothetical protein
MPHYFYRMKTLLIALFCLGSFLTNAQDNFEKVDKYVVTLGSMDSLNVATIAERLTDPFQQPKEKARAVFYWIAHNIKPDLKGMRNNDARKSKPEVVLQNRTATAIGYSKLFQEMMSIANIRCLTVDGYVKRYEDEIDNPFEVNHTWNVVQLGQSPSEWFYVDVTLATGYVDKRFSSFTPNFVSEYFFTHPAVFNLQHYPDNEAWLIGEGPSSLKHFYHLPVLQQHGVASGIYQPTPSNGYFKTKMKKPVLFVLSYLYKAPTSVQIVTGSGKRQKAPIDVNFTIDNNQIKFQHFFLEDGEYPVTVLIDGKPVMEWLGNITE